MPAGRQPLQDLGGKGWNGACLPPFLTWFRTDPAAATGGWCNRQPPSKPTPPTHTTLAFCPTLATTAWLATPRQVHAPGHEVAGSAGRGGEGCRVTRGKYCYR